MRKYPFIFAVIICLIITAWIAVVHASSRAVNSSGVAEAGPPVVSPEASPSPTASAPSPLETGSVSGVDVQYTPSPFIPGPNQKVAYLTFDDGPSKMTPQLLSTLSACRVHATFFVIGLNAEKYPDALKQMVKNGDVVGVHSWTHKYSYIYKDMQNFLDDFDKLSDFIKQTTGVAPNVCRFPGGTNNTVSLSYNKNHIMRTIASEVEKRGFRYFDWNVSSGEASNVKPTADEVRNTVVSQCKNKNVAVILFHDTDDPDYVSAIPGIVSDLHAMGFVLDTLSPENPPSSMNSSVRFKPV